MKLRSSRLENLQNSTLPESLFNQITGRLKKRLRQSVFTKTSGRLFFQAVLYTHSRNNWNFPRKVYFSNNRTLFAVHVVWLLNHEAKTC